MEEIDIEQYKFEHGGYTPEEVQEMIDYQVKKMREQKNKETREVTCKTYERAQSKLNKNVDNWFGIDRR